MVLKHNIDIFYAFKIEYITTLHYKRNLTISWDIYASCMILFLIIFFSKPQNNEWVNPFMSRILDCIALFPLRESLRKTPCYVINFLRQFNE